MLLTIVEIDGDKAKYLIDACYRSEEVGSSDWFYPNPEDSLKEATPLIKALL